MGHDVDRWYWGRRGSRASPRPPDCCCRTAGAHVAVDPFDFDGAPWATAPCQLKSWAPALRNQAEGERQRQRFMPVRRASAPKVARYGKIVASDRKARSPIQGSGVFATRPSQNTASSTTRGEDPNRRACGGSEAARGGTSGASSSIGVRPRRGGRRQHRPLHQLPRAELLHAGIGDTIRSSRPRTSARVKSCRTTTTDGVGTIQCNAAGVRRFSNWVIYLHGMASSAHSGKATYLGERGGSDVPFRAGPEFSHFDPDGHYGHGRADRGAAREGERPPP